MPQTDAASLTQVIFTLAILHIIPLMNYGRPRPNPPVVAPPIPTPIPGTSVPTAKTRQVQIVAPSPPTTTSPQSVPASESLDVVWWTRFWRRMNVVVGTALEIATSSLVWVLARHEAKFIEWCYWLWVATRLVELAAKRAYFDGKLRKNDEYGLALLATFALVTANVTYMNDSSTEKVALAIVSSLATFLWLLIFLAR